MPEKKNKKCVDCGTPISRKAIRCSSCASKKNWIDYGDKIAKRVSESMTTEVRNKISCAIKERHKDPEFKKNYIEQVKNRPKQNRFGEKAPFWKGGITPENQIIRSSTQYKNWRKSVFERDGYRCVVCNSHSDLHAHHKKEFHEFPELRFDVSNGITLCKIHHAEIHGRPIRNIPKQKKEPIIRTRKRKYCIDCKKEIPLHALRCRKCFSIMKQEQRKIKLQELLNNKPQKKIREKKKYYCSVCGNEKSRGCSRCATCYNLSRKHSPSYCANCGTVLSDCRTTRCRKCANALHNQNVYQGLPGTKRKTKLPS
jgi:hypothetical protein